MTLSLQRLARLQRVRAIEEELARASWLAIEARHASALERRTQLCSERAQALSQINAIGTVNALVLLQQHSQLDRILGEIERQSARVETLRRQSAALRQPWQSKRREVAALAKLEERIVRTQKHDELRAESKLMDEVASTRAFSKQRFSTLKRT
jgi:flagellar export protein FliJ